MDRVKAWSELFPGSTKPVPVPMDDELKRQVEAVAKALNQKQAQVMRDAIRKGLPLLKSGGAADVLTLDSELSKEVVAQAERANRTRNSIRLEAISLGTRAVDVYEMIKEGKANEGVEEPMGVKLPGRSRGQALVWQATPSR